MNKKHVAMVFWASGHMVQQKNVPRDKKQLEQPILNRNASICYILSNFYWKTQNL